MSNNQRLSRSQNINHLVYAETSPIPIPPVHTNDIADLSTAELPIVQMTQPKDPSSMMADLATDQLPITSPVPLIPLPLKSIKSEVTLAEKMRAVLTQKRLPTLCSPIAPRLTLPQKLPVQTNVSESVSSLSNKMSAIAGASSGDTAETPLVFSLMRFAL